MEQAGAEVLYLQADANREEEMQKVVQRAIDQFGELNGIIHAAGIVGTDSTKALWDLDQFIF